MNEKEAIKALYLLFGDNTDETYPFTDEFAAAVKKGIEAIEMQINIDKCKEELIEEFDKNYMELEECLQEKNMQMQHVYMVICWES